MIFRIETSIFVLISVSFALTAANDVKEDVEREAHSDRQGLWFGPRLGKRSLSDNDNRLMMMMTGEFPREVYLRMLEAAEAVKYYYNQLPVSMVQRSDPDTRVTKKVIFTPKLGRSAEHGLMEFTPRLGRTLPAQEQRYDSREEGSSGRVRYFSPRLGRTAGYETRELLYDDYPSIRVARSVNQTKNSQK